MKNINSLKRCFLASQLSNFPSPNKHLFLLKQASFQMQSDTNSRTGKYFHRNQMKQLAPRVYALYKGSTS